MDYNCDKDGAVAEDVCAGSEKCGRCTGKRERFRVTEHDEFQTQLDQLLRDYRCLARLGRYQTLETVSERLLGEIANNQEWRGNNIADAVKVDTWEECAGMCNRHPFCKVWSWCKTSDWINAKKCYLKSAKGGNIHHHRNWISGRTIRDATSEPYTGAALPANA